MSKDITFDFCKDNPDVHSSKLFVQVDGVDDMVLPLQVRTIELHLLGNSQTSNWIELDPGQYVIQLQGPDGIRQSEMVELETGQAKKITLSLSRQNKRLMPITSNHILGDQLTVNSGRDNKDRKKEKLFFSVPDEETLSTVNGYFQDSGVRLVKKSIAAEKPFELDAGAMLFSTEFYKPLNDVEQNEKTMTSVPGYLARLLCFDDSSWQVLENNIQTFSVGQNTVDGINSINLVVDASDELQLLEVRKPEGESVCLVIPLTRNTKNQHCLVEIVDCGENFYLKCMLREEPRTSLMMEYLVSGLYQQAADIISDAEEMLQGKVSNPIGAALGGYVLLGIGELEHLHNWPENLCNWFPQIADGAIIAGELAWRKGESKKAFEFFIEASKRGLPIFREGLSLLVARLRSYVLEYTKIDDQNDTDMKQLKSSYEHLVKIAIFMDDNNELLTFSGVSLVAETDEQLGWHYLIPVKEVSEQDHVVTPLSMAAFIRSE